MSRVEPVENGDFGMFAIKKGKGCFISFPIGAAIAFCVAASLVTVGLCVFYLAPSSKTESQLWVDCLSLAEKRQECVCPDSYTTTKSPSETENSTPLPDSTTTATATTTTTAPPELPTGLRLNRTFLPSHYQVELQPRMYSAEDDFGFNGSVVIDITCTEASDLIVLHIERLTIHEDSIQISQLTPADGAPSLSIMKWEEDVDRQFLKLWTSETLTQSSTYRLSMTFNGTLLHPDFGGFYLSTYIEDGTIKYLATTQFQRTDARRAFPCFDEPSFKATFDITLVRKNIATSISNMELKASTIRTDDWVADEYETTVVMPTYLLAFIVSEFQSKDITTPRGTYFRLWARPNFLDSLDYALSVSGEILEAFEDYTGIDYVLNKTDQIAIPDFAAGAMENWGLVTYRETALLYNANYSTMSDKRYIATVISHELAHQWWGNLVTCEWWDETWLNEGFANNYADVMALQAEPTWRLDEYYIRTVWSALGLDDRTSSQPVHVAGIEHHSELGKAFSSITYRKGGSVIRMMKYFLSEETFQRGISKYLDTHKFGNTRRADLYKALEEQAYTDGTVSWDSSKANFTDIMETWIAQMGYPFVHVMDDKNGKLTIEQSHFLTYTTATLPASPVSGSTEYMWQIPLTYISEEDQKNNGTASKFWIYNEKTAEITGVPTSGWKLVNLEEQGFYRVRYEQDLWDLILQQLKDDHTVIPAISRGQILDDAFNLANTGLLDELEALKATEYLSKEIEYLPIYAGLNTRLKVLESLLYQTSAQKEMNTYIANLVKNQYSTVTWDNSDPNEHIEKYVRIIILRENCDKKNKDCLDEATSQYATFMADKNTNPISPDFRSFVYCTAIAQGGVAEFEHAQAMFEQEYSEFIGYERNALVDGMACVREPWLVTRYLEYAKEINDTVMFTTIARKREVQSQVWDFLMANAEELNPRVNVFSIMNALVTYWSTTYDVQKVQLLAEKYPTIIPNAPIQLIEENRKWLEKNQKPIEDWLSSVNSGTSQKMTKNTDHIPEEAEVMQRQRRDIVSALQKEDGLSSIAAV